MFKAFVKMVLWKKIAIIVAISVVILVGGAFVGLQIARANGYLTKSDLQEIKQEIKTVSESGGLEERAQQEIDVRKRLEKSQLSDTEIKTFLDEAYLEFSMMGKPVIYLYPEQQTDVSVKLSIDGKLTATYPEYKNGWVVTANPDGTLINHDDNQEYSYLFWEGTTNNEFDMSKGFVVKGSDTAKFLQEKLSYMGLTPREYNEFIVYWLPILQENPYNLISFQGENYTQTAKLDISPKPDSLLRIFMAYQPLENPIEIEEQSLVKFDRTGFCAVEWGAGEVK